MKSKHVGIPLLFFILYIAGAVLVLQFVDSHVYGTLIVDVVMLVIAGLYYTRCVGDASMALQPACVPVTAVALVAVWFVSSVTTTWLGLTWPSVFEQPVIVSEAESLWYLLLTVVVAPMTEEFLFRGILFRHLKQAMPVAWAFIVTNAIFAMVHGTVAHLYGGLVAGMLFTLVYEYTGVISASVMVHAGYNLLTILLARIGIPDSVFQLWAVVPMNVIMVVAMVFAGWYIESGLAERRGVRQNKTEPKAKFLKAQSGLTVGMVAGSMLPGCVILVWDQAGVQLFNGTAEAVLTNAILCSRHVAEGQSFAYGMVEGGQANAYLVIKVR